MQASSGAAYQTNNIPRRKKKKGTSSVESVNSQPQKSPSYAILPKVAKDTEELRRDVQAQLEMLRGGQGNDTNLIRDHSAESLVSNLALSMGADKINLVLNHE